MLRQMGLLRWNGGMVWQFLLKFCSTNIAVAFWLAILLLGSIVLNLYLWRRQSRVQRQGKDMVLAQLFGSYVSARCNFACKFPASGHPPATRASPGLTRRRSSLIITMVGPRGSACIYPKTEHFS